MSDREFDVVLYGATGFVGRLTAEHLARHAPDGTRIALAGRNQAKLDATRASLKEARAPDWPTIVADANDDAALAELARRTTCVATTVGPYAAYGMPLAEACANHGTHYADLTGEVLFMRRTADKLHDPAKAQGARIVHACGFDTIPSDLGVLLLHEHAKQSGETLTDTTLAVTALRGGLSGGTLASMKGQLAEFASDPSAQRLVADPYALSPDRDREPDRTHQHWQQEQDLRTVTHDRDLDAWLAPFVMAPSNTRVVRRSNALLDWAYGKEFRYREVMAFRGPTAPLIAGGLTAGLAAFVGVMTVPTTRKLADRFLPQPGDGPSEKVRANGHFTVEVTAKTSGGKTLVSTVAAKGDPGYAATAVMLGESALALALDGDRLPDRAGVLTPATGIGMVLADRLRNRGFTARVK